MRECNNSRGTVLIPTHNRGSKLLRLLGYLDSYDWPIVIVDSSENPADTSSFKNVTHIKDHSLKFKDKVVEGCKLVETDLVVLAADDDFPQLSEIECHLSESTDFSLLIGRIVMFNESFEDGSFWYQKASEPTGFFGQDLIEDFMGNYSQVLWGCFKREDLQSCFELMQKSAFSNDNFIELFIATWMLSREGILKLDKALCVREVTREEHWGGRHKSLRHVFLNAPEQFLKDWSQVHSLIGTEVFARSLGAYLLNGNSSVGGPSKALSYLSRIRKGIAYKAGFRSRVEQYASNSGDFIRIRNAINGTSKVA
jgi:glycosyltransferase domain-containing protein